MQPKILVVDDEEAMTEVLRIRLEEWGYAVDVALSVAEAQALVQSFKPNIVVSDVVMPELSGLDLLKLLKEGEPERPVILITAHGTIEMAVEAMKMGANDFLTKPLDYSRLRLILEVAQEKAQAIHRERPSVVTCREDSADGLGPIVGKSRAIRRVFRLIEDLAQSGASVLITGESGTGKELVARSIHQMSSRASGPFVPVNASAIPEQLVESEIFGHEKGAFTGAVSRRPGCFELAHEGTLFLDEIAEMPIELQPKILRVLEDGRVRKLGGNREFQFDVRVISATNMNPHEAIKANKLREDLYYRLNVFAIEIPPLRDRKSDIPPLVSHFVSQLNRRYGTAVEGTDDEALACLSDYSWPGNVRELRNVIERAVVLAKRGPIRTSHLPPHVRTKGLHPRMEIALPLGVSAAEAEQLLILKTLEMVGGNKAEAGRRLGLDVKTI
ncbi:MAG: sigma-54-dependent Fis family transcriptional regulator, partial [Acidobacteriota bacterium]